MLKLILKWFDAIFTYSAETEILALFRKSVSVFYLLILLALFPSWNRFYGWNHVSTGAATPLIDIFYVFSGLPFEFLWILGVFICVWHYFGKNPTFSSIALFVFHSALLLRNPFASNGEDLVLRMLFFYSCFFPWSGEGKFQGSWAVRLAQINFIAIYFFSFPKKLAADTSWLTGDFMYMVLVNPNWSRLTSPELALLPGISPMMTYGALLSEATIILLVWFKNTRKIALFSIFFFHSLIAIFLNNVTFFSLSMIIGSIIFYRKSDFIFRSHAKTSEPLEQSPTQQ